MKRDGFKKVCANIAASFSIILITFALASCWPYLNHYTEHQRLFFYDLLFRGMKGIMVIATLGMIIHHYVMSAEWITGKKSVRQAIVLLILVFLTSFVNLAIFSVFPVHYMVIGMVVIALLGLVGGVAGYIVENKMLERDAEWINRRLTEMKEED